MIKGAKRRKRMTKKKPTKDLGKGELKLKGLSVEEVSNWVMMKKMAGMKMIGLTPIEVLVQKNL